LPKEPIRIGRWCCAGRSRRFPPRTVHTALRFRCALWFATITLAHMLDSLVCVPRRVGCNRRRFQHPERTEMGRPHPLRRHQRRPGTGSFPSCPRQPVAPGGGLPRLEACAAKKLSSVRMGTAVAAIEAIDANAVTRPRTFPVRPSPAPRTDAGPSPLQVHTPRRANRHAMRARQRRRAEGEPSTHPRPLREARRARPSRAECREATGAGCNRFPLNNFKHF